MEKGEEKIKMICKNKNCHNTAEDGERYCKYHLVKKSIRNKKILTGLVSTVAAVIFIADKFRKKKK